MLPKNYRLHFKKDFELIFEKGRFVPFSLFNFKLLKNDLQNSRFAFIVSKKISNKAHDRNKIKRQLRAIMNKFIKQIKGNFDVIIITKKNILNKPFLEIEGELTKSLKKTKLLV